MAQRVDLGIRQISTPNEILSLLGIMDMTFINNGRRMVLDIQGIELILDNGEQISLPSGHDRIYSDQFIKVKEPEVSMISRLYYSHPQINGGALTPNKADVYSLEYHDNVTLKDEANADILLFTEQLNSLLTTNYLSNFSGIIGNQSLLTVQTIWDSPTAFGLTSDFHLYERWRTYNNLVGIGRLPLGWVTDWFNSLTYEKVQFLKHEFTNTSNPNSIISILEANSETAEFDTLIGGNLSEVINLATTIEGERATLEQNLSDSETQLENATTFIETWEAAIETVTKYFEIIDGVETEVDPNAPSEQLPINMKILYTKEAQ